MNLVQKSVSQGGKLAPLVIPEGLILGTGLMNPSIFIDSDGEILVNVRHINYILYHSENKQMFPSYWGPLAYLHPENDMRLVSENYICRLNSNLEMINHTRVEMLNLHTPIWEFHGLEDARLVQWAGDYYICGVRRDTTTHGEGRMEYSKIELDKDSWTAKEINRVRMPAVDPYSYCEKNWMPVLDSPFTFVKWSMPTDVVVSSPVSPNTQQYVVKETPVAPSDQRGSSHVFKWGQYYAAITHEVKLFNNYLGQKDGIYTHRLILWDNEFNFKGLSNSFTFLDGRIEFCVGAAVFEGDLLTSFGFADNAAFILRTPKSVVDDLVREALNNYGN